MAFGSIVTYTRAKAEAVGLHGEVGVAPRPERLVLLAAGLIAAGTVGPMHGPQLGFGEIVRRLMLVPTIRRQLAGWVVLGVMAIPLGTFITFLLDERWGLGPGGRGVFAAVQSSVRCGAPAAIDTAATRVRGTRRANIRFTIYNPQRGLEASIEPQLTTYGFD